MEAVSLNASTDVPGQIMGERLPAPPAVGGFHVQAGDAAGAQFWFQVERQEGKQLAGHIKFPQRTRVSIWNGDFASLRRMLQNRSPDEALHDPRWQHEV